jgi:hypothetical protein
MRFVRVLVAIVSSLSLLGCMTVQPLATNPAQLAQEIKPGDRIEVTTKSGQRLGFKVERVDEQGLHGSGHDVGYTDIESIHRRKVDAGRTSLIVLGIAAVVGIAAASGGGGGGSGY